MCGPPHENFSSAKHSNVFERLFDKRRLFSPTICSQNTGEKNALSFSGMCVLFIVLAFRIWGNFPP